MKIFRSRWGEAEWSVPLNELSADLKSMVQLQWRDFIKSLDDADESQIVNAVTLDVIAMLERVFAGADSNGRRRPLRN